MGSSRCRAADREVALDDLPIETGAVFREEHWEAAKKQIREALRNLGYAKAEVDGEALVDVGTHSATLTITVRPGSRYTFGDIQVQTAPNARVAPFLVWEQVRLAIPKGRIFSDKALDEAQRRVFGMGVFGTAKVAAGTPDDGQATRAGAGRRARGRVSYAAARGGRPLRRDPERSASRRRVDEPRFSRGHAQADHPGRSGLGLHPQRVTRSPPATRTEAPRNGPVARLRFEFEQPRFLGRPLLSERSAIEIDRTLEQAYNALSARRHERRHLASLVDGVDLPVVSRGARATCRARPPPAPLPRRSTLGCETTDDRCFVWLSYLEQVVTWDRRDNPIDPRRGTYASLSLQQGGGPLGGDFTFFRVLPDARAYTSFGDEDGLTFAARLRVGELWPWSGNPDDSAVVTRFYAGGGNSMRGFSDRRLSPLLLDPAPRRTRTSCITVPIGGNGMVDGSFEARDVADQRAAYRGVRRLRSGDAGPPGHVRRRQRVVGGGHRPALRDARSARSASTSPTGCRSAVCLRCSRSMRRRPIVERPVRRQRQLLRASGDRAPVRPRP